MRFIAGLLVGAIATLLIASLYNWRWEPPSRLAVVAAAVPAPPGPEPIRSVTIEPLAPEPAPAPTPVSPIIPLQKSAQALAATPRPLPQAESASVVEPTSSLEPVTEATQPPAPEPLSGAIAAIETAVIWKPFHSEVSATGFARRLSTQLGYPFRALREGPARYQVVFDYDTEHQRELLQQQVTALTGFDAI